MGRPQMSSRFVCCRCLKENFVGAGIQREVQREKYHIKDLMCINPGCNGITTKNMEIRYCDTFADIMEKAKLYHREYYLVEDIKQDISKFGGDTIVDVLCKSNKNEICYVNYFYKDEEFPKELKIKSDEFMISLSLNDLLVSLEKSNNQECA